MLHIDTINKNVTPLYFVCRFYRSNVFMKYWLVLIGDLYVGYDNPDPADNDLDFLFRCRTYNFIICLNGIR